jgi:hypothetical protein
LCTGIIAILLRKQVGGFGKRSARYDHILNVKTMRFFYEEAAPLNASCARFHKRSVVSTLSNSV